MANGTNGRLQDRAAVITGGASGIGAATVRRFLDDGAAVMIADVQAEAAETLATELVAVHGDDRVDVTILDVTDVNAVEDLMATAAERFGRLDIVFNNAGISSMGRVDELDLDEWHRVIDVRRQRRVLRLSGRGAPPP